jgi:hypothetical protein
MGNIDSSLYASEFTKKTLQQFGWALGDPIPESMGSLLSDIHARTSATKKPGIYVDAELMTPADVELVKVALQAAKGGTSASNASHDVAAGIEMDEATRQLLQKLQTNQAAPKQTETAEPVQIVDDRANLPEAEPASPPPETVAAPAVTTELPEPLPTVDVPQIEPFCPRCQWDMRLKFEGDVTQLDKEAFVAITLGGSRFKKEYEIFGGKYRVKFRSLHAEENTEIHHQLLIDQRDGHFLNDTEWFMRFFEYRLACSIEQIVVNDKPAIIVPELEEVTNKPLPDETEVGVAPRLVRLRKYVLVGTLKNEVTRRIVGNQFRQFQRLYETLEAMAVEPNFWVGIA